MENVRRCFDADQMKEEEDDEPEYEFFRWEEGEDLKCRAYDEQGNEIPLRIKSDVVVIQ